MTGWKSPALLLLLAAAFGAGVLYIFGLQFAAGELYPEYSSLRADPDGAKLLFESLARLPGVTSARNYLPLAILPDRAATILLLNVSPETLGDRDVPFLPPLEKLAERGNRVVITLRNVPQRDVAQTQMLETHWRVKTAVDTQKHAVHHLYFTDAPGWGPLESVGPKLVAIERKFGRGSIALIAASDDFSNMATAAADRLDLVSKALGGNMRVIFDESHLGIAESGSVVGLARRFRLTGLALGLGVLAALFLWRNASGFPSAAQAGESARPAGRPASMGLLTLLRRHVPPSELTQVCWREFIAANRRALPPERLSRAEAIARAMPDRPLDAAREIHAALHPKSSALPKGSL